MPNLSCPRSLLAIGIGCAIAVLAVLPARSADFTARDITELLFHADAARPLDLRHKNLQNLDLAGLDFKRARLEGADLFGADLSGADISGANLQAARLDRVIMIGSRFDGADLTGATVLRPSTFSEIGEPNGEASSFVRANLSGAKVFGRLSGFNFQGAQLRRTSFAPFNETGFIEHIWHTDLQNADLSRADLQEADLTYVSLRFANLKRANLRGAILKNADLSHADLTEADLTNADLSGADLDRAILRDAIGLETVLGIASTHNRSKAMY